MSSAPRPGATGYEGHATAAREPVLRAPSHQLFALIDVNSFYVSCQRVFEPWLNGRPVVVLSNNDGCCIALSKEAKESGIQMGEPWFKLAPRAARLGLTARSSNYELYGDMSSRVMQVIGEHSPQVEIYSIDEAFAGYRGPLSTVLPFARDLRADIRRKLDLPVCVGMGPTKTLAKLANGLAKSFDHLQGVCIWDTVPESARDTLLSRLPVQKVWGVGRKMAEKLQAAGIGTVADLRDADPVVIRRRFSVTLMRTVLELRGEPCIDLDESRDLQDQLIFSRSFARPVTTAKEMEEVISSYAQRAASRLRQRSSQAKTLTIYARTAAHSPWAQHAPSITVPLRSPTSDPLALTRAAKALLPLLIEGTRYAKAGLVLTDLSRTGEQLAFDLFAEPAQEDSLGPLLEEIRSKAGAHAIGLGRSGMKTRSAWEMRRDMMSPRFTTAWDEVLEVSA